MTAAIQLSPLLASLAALGLGVGIWHFGRQRSAYHHLRHTISELGETGAPQGRQVSFGLFLPFGLCMLTVALLNREASPSTAALAACLAVGYLGAWLFPCDPGSPVTGSWRQSLHNLTGGVQYIGGALAISQLSAVMPLSGVLAAVVGVAGLLLAVPAVAAWRGLIQRIAELVLLGTLVAALTRVATI